MKYSHASHKDRSNTWQWSHKIVMDYKQEVCLQCWKKRLAPAMMDVEFTAALNGLNGGGGAQHADHLPCALQRLGLGAGEGVRGACPLPPRSHTPAHRLASLHFSFSLSFLLDQTRKNKCPSPSSSLPLSLPPLLFIISLLKLYIWVAFNLCCFSPLLSLDIYSCPLLSLQWHLPPQPFPVPPMSTLGHTHFTFRLYFYCNFSMFRCLDPQILCVTIA